MNWGCIWPGMSSMSSVSVSLLGLFRRYITARDPSRINSRTKPPTAPPIIGANRWECCSWVLVLVDEVVGSLVIEPDLEGVEYWMTDWCKSKRRCDVHDTWGWRRRIRRFICYGAGSWSAWFILGHESSVDVTHLNIVVFPSKPTATLNILRGPDTPSQTDR